MPKFRNIRIKKPGGGTRIQRAQVLKSGKLKFVKNVKRARAKVAKGRKKQAKRITRQRKAVARVARKRAAKKGNPNNKTPKIGASIQAFKGTQAVLAPVVDAAAVSSSSQQFVSALQGKANFDYVGNIAIEALNQAVDHKSAHATALSGGSLTAWAAEGFAGIQAFNAGRGKDARSAAQAVNQKLSRTIRAYDPSTGGMVLGDEDFRIYQTLKIGGAVARRLSGMSPFRKIAAPLKRMLSSLGGRL